MTLIAFPGWSRAPRMAVVHWVQPPQPLSYRRYTVCRTVNREDQGRESECRSLHPHTNWSFLPVLRRVWGGSSVSGVAGHRKTGLDTGTRGFVAFCGNNQQVVAKQGYECISSAVNTVARRVPQPFFCHDFSLKRCRFYALGRAASRRRGKKDEGQGPDFR